MIAISASYCGWDVNATPLLSSWECVRPRRLGEVTVSRRGADERTEEPTCSHLFSRYPTSAISVLLSGELFHGIGATAYGAQHSSVEAADEPPSTTSSTHRLAQPRASPLATNNTHMLRSFTPPSTFDSFFKDLNDATEKYIHEAGEQACFPVAKFKKAQAEFVVAGPPPGA